MATKNFKSNTGNTVLAPKANNQSSAQPATIAVSYKNDMKGWFMIFSVTVFMLLFILQGKAQKFTLVNPAPMYGRVTDVNGQPLSGVKISTLPQFNHALTDQNGAFSISVSRFTKSLQAEKPGYTTKKIILKSYQEKLSIVLQQIPDSSLHKANIEKIHLIGTASTASEKTEAAKKEMGHRSLLAQKIPGIQISNGAIPGGRNIQIRGLGYSFNRLPNAATESYAHQAENGFKAAQSSPLSTFSIDVDKASYSNVRRFINEGSLPPENAVRIEELINYFDYHYDQPTGHAPVHIQTQLSTAPWNPKHYLLQIGLQAKKVATDDLPPSNLVFLIDVSGSMASANKLPLLISSFKMLTDQLRHQDYVSIVTYAGYAQDLLSPTSGTDKATIKAALDQLRAYGSTNGAGGLEKAYKMAEKHFKKGGNNRIILASDGDFNVGASSLEDLEKLITTQRKSGVFLSVLAFGMGNLRDDKMELLADKGNGNYAYIDNSAEARRVFLQEFGGTLFTVASDVKVQVEFNPGIVEVYRLVGYENRALADADFNRDSVDAGEMGSGNTVTALYEIIPRGLIDDFSPNTDTLRYAFKKLFKIDAAQNELATVKIRYKEPEGKTSKLISQAIVNRVIPANQTSASYQLAAAAAGWGMLLKHSQYVQQITYGKVAELIQQALKTDQGSEIGEFLNLVKTSQALVGNEVKSQGEPVYGFTPVHPPVIIRPLPIPRPDPGPLPHPQPLPYQYPRPQQAPPKDTVPTFRVIPIYSKAKALVNYLR